MMKFIADFHIHSHFSIATSASLVPEWLDYWARLKGVTVVGTGDFTHPGWLLELREKLEPAEPGLFRLKKELRKKELAAFPSAQSQTVRFMLTGEISSIYKKGGRVRKVHNLLFAPGWDAVERLQRELTARKGNITSDGRPILGMDSRELLNLALDVSGGSIFFVPAHIWTPWFSVLGGKSGFDSIEECFEDLSRHIHAVETGLSSDPPMNRMCRFLDRYTLISNSDAHSPEKIGREANLFETELAYDSIVKAIQEGTPGQFLGTLEFFPQEGKYHFDGHRKCAVRLHPSETIRLGGSCPHCGKPLTVGVLNRVLQLKDQKEGEGGTLPHPFHSLIPIREIMAEILRTGPAAKKIDEFHSRLLKKLGPELQILIDIPVNEIRRIGGDELAEGVRRMRRGEVFLEEGYDGEYGRIRVFAENEVGGPDVQKVLFAFRTQGAPERKKMTVDTCPEPPKHDGFQKMEEFIAVVPSDTSNPEQLSAIRHAEGPALIKAGPGTGKTFVLASRIAFLITERSVSPEEILAITFTNKAAQEMSSRLNGMMEAVPGTSGITISTFHAFGLNLLRDHCSVCGRTPGFWVLGEEDRLQVIKSIPLPEKAKAAEMAEAVSRSKQGISGLDHISDPRIKGFAQRYEERLRELNAFDLDDLNVAACDLLLRHPEIVGSLRRRFRHVLVDESQDMNEVQFQILKLLQPPPDANLCLIGDPDQAIYGFRGADSGLIDRFLKEYPGVSVYVLNRSYRCSDLILKASMGILKKNADDGRSLSGLTPGVKVRLAEHPTQKSEAEFIARTIESMVGGVRFYSMDSRIATGEGEDGIGGFSGFAVLCRLSDQMFEIGQALHHHGIPFQTVEDPPFFKKEPVRTILDLLRYSLNPENSFLKTILERRDLLRSIPSYHWQKVTSESYSLSAVQDKLNMLIRELFPFLSGEEGRETERLTALAEGYGADTDRFMKFAILGSGADVFRRDLENVAVLTIHAAKGLEFDCVFIPGCEEGLLPFSLLPGRVSSIEEEKRLLYVGMTRARRFLFLTHAGRRTVFGNAYNLPRSSFLNHIETELYELSRPDSSQKPPEPRQLELFKSSS